MRARQRPAHARSGRSRPSPRVVVWSFLLLLLTSLGIEAADLTRSAHTAWPLGDGILPAYPRSLAQTADGYFWIGTDQGLVRFDGNRFMTWTPGSGRELPNPSIARLVGSRDGSLWIGTLSGLARLKNDDLIEYPEFGGKYVAALLEARDGTIWVGTNAGRGGSAVLCAIRGSAVQCQDADGALGRFVSTLYEDARGRLWVGAATGIWQWRPQQPQRFQVPYAFPEIHAITEDADGRLLIAINEDIHRFVDGRLEPYAPAVLPAGLRPTALLRDTRGRLWIGRQDRGIIRVAADQSETFARKDGLSGEFVSTLFEDREGNVWIATLNGFDRFRELAVSTLSTDHGLLSERVTSVVAGRDGAVWVGSVGGLNRWNDGRVTTPQLGGGGNGYIASTYEDAAGHLWVSSPSGLARVVNGVISPIPGIGPGYIHAIDEDTAGNLWVADQERGLLRLRDGAVVERTPWAVFGNRVARTLATVPRDSGVWLGFFEGSVAHFVAGRVTMYTAAAGLGRGRVSHLAIDDDGAVWASTESGVSRLRDGHARTLTTKNGLPCNRMHWVIADHERALWVYTECGLARIPRDQVQAWVAATNPDHTITFRLFDAAQGVRSYVEGTSYSPTVSKSSDGRLWFTTDQGLGIVDPARLPFNRDPPPVYVEQATADGRTYAASAPVALPPLTRDLRIDYTAIGLGVPEKMQFRYKLEGRDRDWIAADVRRSAYFTDLPPGKYRFLVIAANSDGVWNNDGTAWDFSITPAFHQRAVVRIAAAALLAAGLWALYRARLRQVAAMIDIRFEERLAERTRIAQELHDTLLQAFVSASMHLHVLAEEVTEHPIRARLDFVLLGIRRALEEGRRSVSGLRTAVAVDDLERTLARDAEFFRTEQSAEVRIITEGARRPLQPLIRDELYRIAREALSNAVRHAGATRIDVEFEYSAEQVRLSVRDNGRGMDNAAKGTDEHWGMRGMRERAESIGATLRVWSRPDVGTEVELVVAAGIAFALPMHARRSRS